MPESEKDLDELRITNNCHNCGSPVTFATVDSPEVKEHIKLDEEFRVVICRICWIKRNSR